MYKVITRGLSQPVSATTQAFFTATLLRQECITHDFLWGNYPIQLQGVTGKWQFPFCGTSLDRAGTSAHIQVCLYIDTYYAETLGGM